MKRVIFHCDLNGFYASVECLHHPEIRHLPVVVCGDSDKRHGIILAKNEVAKQFHIQTGEAIWQAKQRCPNLVTIAARPLLYLRFSKLVRSILLEYTDLIEPYGIDEAWLDVTDIQTHYTSVVHLADEIRNRIFREVGITASIGISDNKIYAKFASDYKKPNATTLLTNENRKFILYPKPTNDLFYVGRATSKKMHTLGIDTIGDIIESSPSFLKRHFGKWGEYIWVFANGLESTPVSNTARHILVKSIGNSTTTPRDLKTIEETKLILYILSESIAARLKEQNLLGQVVTLYLRSNNLSSFTRQITLPTMTSLSQVIAEAALSLVQEHYDFSLPLRSIGIKVSHLSIPSSIFQYSLFEESKEKDLHLEQTVELIRKRFGYQSVKRGMMLVDKELSILNPKEDHIIFPESYF